MSTMYKVPPVISFQGRTAVRFLEAITSLTISDNFVTSTRHVKVSKKKKFHSLAVTLLVFPMLVFVRGRQMIENLEFVNLVAD